MRKVTIVSKAFRTSKDVFLTLRPVDPDMFQKCEQVWKANQGQPDEIAAVQYLNLLSELFEDGITPFKLTPEQAATVVLFRAELIKKMPTLKRNISEWAYFVITTCGGEYPEMTRLALAILEETKNDRPGKEKAKTGFLPFGRLALPGKQAG